MLMDRRKRGAVLLYLCAFPSAEAAIIYAEDRGLGGLGYSVCGLKIEIGDSEEVAAGN